MNKFHIPSLIFDIFYAFDLYADWTLYAVEDSRGILIETRDQIREEFKGKFFRPIVKFILWLPLYFFTNTLYILKGFSIIHLKTLFKLGRGFFQLVCFL